MAIGRNAGSLIAMRRNAGSPRGAALLGPGGNLASLPLA